jgi:hypothetical protein
MSVENNKQIARRALEAMMAGRPAPIGDLLAPDAKLHQCGFLEPIPAAAFLKGGFGARRWLRNQEVRLDHMIGEGDVVAIHWSTSGTYVDDESPELDNRQVAFPSMTFLRLDGGKIAEIWNIRDVPTLETQLREAAESAGRSPLSQE